MRLGLFLTTLIGLAGASQISSAADATWIAVSTLENLACATQFGPGLIAEDLFGQIPDALEAALAAN